MNPVSALAGGIFAASVEAAGAGDDSAQLHALVDDLGRHSFQARLGHRGPLEQFDGELWRNLEDTGLARLTSTPDLDAGPVEAAMVLCGLARHAGAVPVAESDLLAAWLADRAGLNCPGGPLTVAIGEANIAGDRIAGTAGGVPWTRTAAAVVLAARTAEGVHVAVADPGEIDIVDGHNIAGEPRDRIAFDMPGDRFREVDAATFAELLRRGAWARCVQVIGALDTTARLSVAHTRERVQFGRPLSKFQSVQHVLAAMAGEIERARAATTLAVVAATSDGFDAGPTDYAVTVAKVVLGAAVSRVTTMAHQLHGAVGVTAEHQLWLFTMRAQSWIAEFGATGDHARKLGRLALRAENPWDIVIGTNLTG